jgi:hypothetical protein
VNWLSVSAGLRFFFWVEMQADNIKAELSALLVPGGSARHRPDLLAAMKNPANIGSDRGVFGS